MNLEEVCSIQRVCFLKKFGLQPSIWLGSIKGVMGNDCRSYVSMNLNRIRLKVSFQQCSCCGSTSSKQRRLNQTRVNKRRGRQFWKIFKGYVLSGNGTWEMRKEESRKTTKTMYFTGSLEISVNFLLIHHHFKCF